MKFMMLVKASKESEAGVLPTAEQFACMGAYNEELVKAGVVLGFDGLQASSKGVRIKFDGGRPTITDGPFAETKELLAGYWLIQVKSKEEAVEWASRIPFEDGEEVEVRQIFEASDFPAELTAAAEARLAEKLRERQETNAADPR